MHWKFKSVLRPEWVERLVLRDEIYFSHPSELNDPSETRFKFRYDLSERYEDLVDRFVANHPEVSQENGMDFVSRLMDGREFQQLERILRDEIFNHFRVFCLTRTCTNPVMWGHYADNHGGVCVGIESERIMEPCGVAVCADVCYQDEPFNLKFDPNENMRSMLLRLAPALFTKDASWSYEREVRLVTFQQPSVQTAAGAVRSIVLGFRATPETHRRVLHWKELKPDLRVFQVRPPQQSSYELEIVPVS